MGIVVAAAPSVVVLRSRLAPPRRDPAVIARPRLLERLRAMSHLPLTLVSAPPGFGKTTLLTQWAAEREPGTTGWLSVEPGDNDPRRLWAHVCAALGVEGPLPDDPADAPASSAILVAAALNAAQAAGVERALVIDDYHHVTNPACHERIRFLVEHLPAPLHVVIATRRDPPLPLARMRAGAALGELRAADLRMLPDESARLLEGHGMALGPDEARVLHDKTEGWAAALYLAVLSLRRCDDPRAFMDDFSGSARHVGDYLAAEVLAAEDADGTDFLLRTSVLDRMSGALCDAVLGTTGSVERLRRLERDNLLVWSLDGERTWFRYHPLLADLLRFMLAESQPGEAAALHLRAAAWWEAEGDPERAIEHALAARDAARAARIVGAHWLELAGRRGAAPVIDRWMERLPAAVVLADPGLCLARAVLEEARGGAPDQVERWVAAAEAAGGAPGSHGDGEGRGPLPFGTGSVLLEAALVRAASGGHDVGRRLAGATRARRLAAQAGAPARVLAGTHLAHAQWLAGNDAEALAAARAAMAEDGARALPLPGAIQHAIASLALAGLGDAAAADEEARAAVARMRVHGHEETPRACVVWLAQGGAYARRGDPARAEDALRRAVALSEGPGLALERARALLALAAVLRERGDVGGAAEAVGAARRIVARSADPGPLRRLLAGPERLPDSGLHEPVSDAEMRILRLLPEDLSQRQIGERLYLSLNTIKSHSRVLYRKLGVTGRAEAVERARELGLLPGPPR